MVYEINSTYICQNIFCPFTIAKVLVRGSQSEMNGRMNHFGDKIDLKDVVLPKCIQFKALQTQGDPRP